MWKIFQQSKHLKIPAKPAPENLIEKGAATRSFEHKNVKNVVFF